jgi:hypothetical protein
MRLVERFTRTAARTLDYEYMVHDEGSFAGTWTVKFPMTRDPGPIYETACHEGNYSLPLILSAARALEPSRRLCVARCRHGARLSAGRWADERSRCTRA